MSIQPRPDPEYTRILGALKTGQRIAFDTQAEEGGKKFVILAKDDPKQKDNRFITDLNLVKSEIVKYIEIHGISEPQKAALEKAFEKRAKRLEKKTIWFGDRKKQESIIKTQAAALRSIIGAIEETITKSREKAKAESDKATKAAIKRTAKIQQETLSSFSSKGASSSLIEASTPEETEAKKKGIEFTAEPEENKAPPPPPTKKPLPPGQPRPPPKTSKLAPIETKKSTPPPLPNTEPQPLPPERKPGPPKHPPFPDSIHKRRPEEKS